MTSLRERSFLTFLAVFFFFPPMWLVGTYRMGNPETGSIRWIVNKLQVTYALSKVKKKCELWDRQDIYSSTPLPRLTNWNNMLCTQSKKETNWNDELDSLFATHLARVNKENLSSRRELPLIESSELKKKIAQLEERARRGII